MAQTKWYQLDNAAKIVPSTAGGSDSRVFRITCELKEEVDPEILQRAVTTAAREFPHFSSILKEGMFWYYLDQSNLEAEVTPDNRPALDTIYREGRRNLLYRVNYYGRRINLEMFDHVAGLKPCFHCRRIRYDLPQLQMTVSRAAGSDRQDDAFGKYYKKEKEKPEGQKNAPVRAYHLRGDRDENLQNHLLEGTVSVAAFLAAARERNATVAELSTALFIQATLREMSVRDKKLPIVLSVPVNLRNYFPSETARNFFGVINVVYDPALYEGTLESIIPVVRESFRKQLRQDQVELTMNSYAALEHNIAVKVVPLLIKNLVVSAINARMQRGITGTISNVGKITVPEEMAPYIEKFSCFMAAPEVQVCLCSYKDKLVFGVASAFIQQPIIRDFFRDMVDMGIEVVLESNDFDRAVPAFGEGPGAQSSGGAEVRSDAAAKLGAEERSDAAAKPDAEARSDAAARPGAEVRSDAAAKLGTEVRSDAAAKPGAEERSDAAAKPDAELRPDAVVEPHAGAEPAGSAEGDSAGKEAP